jgi:hypothetical protein
MDHTVCGDEMYLRCYLHGRSLFIPTLKEVSPILEVAGLPQSFNAYLAFTAVD